MLLSYLQKLSFCMLRQVIYYLDIPLSSTRSMQYLDKPNTLLLILEIFLPYVVALPLIRTKCFADTYCKEIQPASLFVFYFVSYYLKLFKPRVDRHLLQKCEKSSVTPSFNINAIVAKLLVYLTLKKALHQTQHQVSTFTLPVHLRDVLLLVSASLKPGPIRRM